MAQNGADAQNAGLAMTPGGTVACGRMANPAIRDLQGSPPPRRDRHKHANSTSFKPGKSGNPSGRPRVILEVRDIAREYTPTAFNTLWTICRDPKAPAAARVSAADTLIAYGYGRPPQAVAIANLTPAPDHPVADAAEAASIYAALMAGTTALEGVCFEAPAVPPGGGQ